MRVTVTVHLTRAIADNKMSIECTVTVIDTVTVIERELILPGTQNGNTLKEKFDHLTQASTRLR
jgi:hypothetical protein